MKRLVVVLALATAAALMLVGCTPMVALPSADEAFWGMWVNEDPDTGGITRVEIAPWTVHMWGSCTPTDCDWGEAPYAIHEDQLHVVWDQGFVVHVQILEIMAGGSLRVDTTSYYTDGSGTTMSTEMFLREIVIQ
jgi:hypothetical protein